MGLLSYIFPQKVAEFDSKYNGTVKVMESIGRRYIDVGGLMQSGKIPEKLFSQGFKKIGLLNQKKVPKKILILGLGGGSVVKVLNKYFPDAKLTAIEIDPVMVKVGEDYFALKQARNLHIRIGDTLDRQTRFGKEYDIIIVDLFQGYEIPEKIKDREFLQKLKAAINKNGMVIFNRLYFQKYVFEADEFLDKVKEIFQDVTAIKNYFNLLICAK